MPDNEAEKNISGTLLAFDFGEQRIGVAIGHMQIGIAHPLQTIVTDMAEMRFKQIALLIKEWQPTLLIVGLPYDIEGQIREIARLARRFARRLQGRFDIKVAMWDERFSSFAASEALKQIGLTGRGQKKVVDQVAAQQILQHYFDTPNQYSLLVQP